MEGPVANASTRLYYPLEANAENHVANTMDAPVLLFIFASGCAAILAATYVIAKRTRPTICHGGIAIAFWWVLCGFIHSFFEGYFAYNHSDIVRRSDLFAQLWKEYSLSDSRYMTRDAFTVCMETVTAMFWGPGSFFVAYAFLTDHPLRYPAQLVVSLGQLYGDVLYYAIYWYEESVNGTVYCRPERYYYWAYFVLCNAFWIVIPLAMIWQSVWAIGRVFEKSKQAADGSAKKLQ
ncbi:uncharacterized protein UV8b_06098 [Ustilaginoidea virens]|uniref:EXPERA domain-containing protein n=1 Tax=Ustilaginoidea virens TaxID=1159556 RepID=A0A1B5L9Z7_USTVR|nr:uncharacterized protein UV8b_06098 [Ustilaginoidea virens]QUC21857.1 hypothetical protein UV8b_06098 [Ustilaginoidea virens]GAO19699.1 hypothetical protein UVI_02064350 [Ustilaginoidea virens]